VRTRSARQVALGFTGSEGKLSAEWKSYIKTSFKDVLPKEIQI
jgi:hypothetical protein